MHVFIYVCNNVVLCSFNNVLVKIIKFILTRVRFRGKKPCGKLVLMVFDVTRSLASMRITFLVRSRGQKISSALMIFTSSVSVEKYLDLCFELG